MLHEGKEEGAVASQGRLGYRRATLLNMIGDAAQGLTVPKTSTLGRLPAFTTH